MLFNSPEFLLFLPLALILYYAAAKLGRLWAKMVLVAASLVFYAWGGTEYLSVICGSVVMNYLVGIGIQRSGRKGWVICGIVLNLAVLGCFKYLNYLGHAFSALTGRNYYIPVLVIPLGISFYTFQQISYLVDLSSGKTKDTGFIDYVFFVLFFPQLVAGPIARHNGIVPQLEREDVYRPNAQRFEFGLRCVVFGLFQKVILADNLGSYADAVFSAIQDHEPLGAFPAWAGLLAFTFQFYLDFAAYSTIAVGVGAMFGITLPENFRNPYAACSIREYWSRCHITMTNFFRDYVYIPMGGNRRGSIRRAINVMVTMGLAGQWHRGSPVLLLWGLLQGVLVNINHAWSRLGIRLPRAVALPLTLLVVTLSFSMYRSPDLPAARRAIESLSGKHGLSLPIPGHAFFPESTRVWRIHSQPAFEREPIPNAGLVGYLVLMAASVLLCVLPNLERRAWTFLFLFFILTKIFFGSAVHEFFYFQY